MENYSDQEWLRKIYIAQLRTMMDVKILLNNVHAIRKKIEPEAYNVGSGAEPYHWEHLDEIHKELEGLAASVQGFLPQPQQDQG